MSARAKKSRETARGDSGVSEDLVRSDQLACHAQCQPMSIALCRKYGTRSLLETSRQMVIHHPCRLHKGVANSRADELKSAFFQGFAHRIGFSGAGGNFRHCLPVILNGLIANK